MSVLNRIGLIAIITTSIQKIKQRRHAPLGVRGFKVIHAVAEVIPVQLYADAFSPGLYSLGRYGHQPSEGIEDHFALRAVSVNQSLHNVNLQRAYVHLLASLALGGIVGAHAVHIVPHCLCPASGRYHHESGR